MSLRQLLYCILWAYSVAAWLEINILLTYLLTVSMLSGLSMLSYFKKVNDSHNHNTRNNTLSFKVRYRRTSKKALSICVKGTKMWNALSSDIKLSRNVNAFKKMLKALLLENY